MASRPTGHRGYAIAIATAGVAVAATAATVRPLGGAYLYLPLLAVFASALQGGLGPGLVTVALCVIGFDLLYLGPPFHFGVATSNEGHRLAAFALFGAGASWIAARARSARRDAEAASEQARRIGEMQERLVAIVGHDLRNPLAALVGNLHLLARLGPLSDRQAHVVANMRRTSSRMEAMIRDLLDLERSRHGGLAFIEPSDVRVGDLCARVVAEMRAAHPAAELSLAVEGEDQARVDPERIAQAVSNLVANAIVHGRRGAPVRVRVTSHGEELAIDVQNAGEPIPPDLRKEIFEPFRRGGGRGHGVGLGLFVVREVARAHGGTVAFRSDAVETVFEIRLPRPGPPVEAADTVAG